MPSVRSPFVVGVLLLLSGCAAAGNVPSNDRQDVSGAPATDGASQSVQTEDCVTAIQQQVDEALAAFEAPDADGREALLAVQRLDPRDCPSWDGEAEALALEAEAERVLSQMPTDQSDLDPKDYSTLTGLAIVAAALRPAPTYDVPDGFPAEFPVMEGAELVTSDREGDNLSASWQVDNPGGFMAVEDFYGTELQTMVPGRWTSSGSSGGVMQGGGTVLSGDLQYDVTGYGLKGTVDLTKVEGEETVTVQTTLAPAE